MGTIIDEEGTFTVFHSTVSQQSGDFSKLHQFSQVTKILKRRMSVTVLHKKIKSDKCHVTISILTTYIDVHHCCYTKCLFLSDWQVSVVRLKLISQMSVFIR